MAIIADLQSTIEYAVKNPEEFCVRLSEVWEDLGYTRKENCVSLLKSRLIESEDYTRRGLAPSGEKPMGGRPGGEYFMTGDAFKDLCISANTPQGRELRRYYIKVEKEYRKLLTASLNRPEIDVQSLYQQLGCQSQEISTLKDQVKALQADRENLRSVSGTSYAERPNSKTMVYNLAQVRAIIGYHDEAYTWKVIHECMVKGRDFKILCSDPGKEDLMITEAALQELAIVARSSRGCRTDRLPELLVVERSRLFQEPTGKGNTRHGQSFT
jgi:phage anti-repressor protein